MAELPRYSAASFRESRGGLTVTTDSEKWVYKGKDNDIYQTDNPLHLAYQAWNRQRGRMSGQIRMRVLYQMYRSHWFDYLMVSPQEMQTILEGTGWKVKRFIQPVQKSAYAAVLVKD